MTQENILRMCRAHHTEQHKRGWRFMSETYPVIRVALKIRGWEFQEIFGVWKLTRKSEF